LFSRTYRVPSYLTARPGQAEALEILAGMIGGDENAALYRRLVVEQKLATDVGASYDGDARDSGEFTVYATPRPGVALEQVEHAVDAVIASFIAAPPSAADFARVKTQLIAGEVYKRDNQLSLATAYGQALVNGRSVADVHDWPRRLNTVPAQAVQAAAATFLIRREAVTLYLMPAHV